MRRTWPVVVMALALSAGMGGALEAVNCTAELAATPVPVAWEAVVLYRDAEGQRQEYVRPFLRANDAHAWAARAVRRGFAREWAYGNGGGAMSYHPANRVLEVVVRPR